VVGARGVDRRSVNRATLAAPKGKRGPEEQGRNLNVLVDGQPVAHRVAEEITDWTVA
jgi:hypothetical protein